MKQFMLIGSKLSHSFSASYFNEKFKNMGINARYYLCELPNIKELPAVIAAMPELVGFNVTIPYKEQIIPFLDSLTVNAQRAHAVNCVKIIRTTQTDKGYFLIGDNTDMSGFRLALNELLISAGYQISSDSSDLRNVSALILGSGGAAKGVAADLKLRGCDPIIVSRSVNKGDITYSELTPGQVWNADIIINATPVGMFPDIMDAPHFPYQYMRSGQSKHRYPQIALDLIYNPEDTLFMKICRAHGAIVGNGLPMLFGQAEEAWKFWNSCEE